MSLPLSDEFLARPQTVAHSVATFLARSGVRRIYGLTGSHIKPLWDEATKAGIRVIDVRHEVAAVHMAQADAELTGELAVATVTTGPGLTNAVTGLAAASQCRSPILVLSAVPPREQLGLGALEELDQAEFVRPVTRLARTVMNPRQLLPFLDAAFAAAIGVDGPPGPVYLDFPTDVLRGPAHEPIDRVRGADRVAPAITPADAALDDAAAAIKSASRPVLISGSGLVRDAAALEPFLDASGALYLDTPESRGLLPADHPASIPAARSAAMKDADLIITVGRRLDFSLAYGSPAVFRSAASFLRIGRTFDELAENRPGEVQVKADAGAALAALTKRVTTEGLDTEWVDALRSLDRRRRASWLERATTTPYGPDNGIHPNALIHAINTALAGTDAVLVADGGDILSFARVGLNPPARLDTGTFGCLGVGVPFANAASVIHPDREVVALVGDGAFGFNAMELDTARRCGAKPVFVISNNSAWNIERHDHIENYAANPDFNTELPDCRYDVLATAFGLHATRITSVDELAPALDEALRHAPALIDVRTSREVTSPDFAGGLADLPNLHAVRAWHEAELDSGR